METATARTRPQALRHSSTTEVPAQAAVPPSGMTSAPAAGQSAELHDILSELSSEVAAPIPYRSEMEARFGMSFAGVQAHLGGGARGTLNGLGAVALTAGEHVAFQTSSPSRALVAHELAHVVQQRQAPSVQRGIGSSSDRHEERADFAASQVMLGASVDAGSLSAGAAPASVQLKKEPMPESFEKMWEAHPHNNSSGNDENTSSADVNKNLGFDPAVYQNTCAIRMSVMFNTLGGNYAITRPKAAAAGIDPKRVVYSKSTKSYIILSAKEMWMYVTKMLGTPHQTFPKGRYKTADEFNAAWPDIQPVVAAQQGIVAFDKIFGYGGTGHVDIFNGEQLSAASSWYPCQQLKLWYMPTQ